MRKKRLLFFVLSGVLLCTSFSFAASEVTKEYIFHPDSEKDLTYDTPKTITENGKEYKLKAVKCRLSKGKTVTKSVTTRDKSKYEKSITETIDGKNVKLTAQEPAWKEVKAEGKTVTAEYKSRSEIPEQMTSTRPDAEGNEMQITLKLTDVDTSSRTENFSAPARFYSPSADGTLYMFNGKRVQIDGSSPTWSGYVADVKSYLGVNGNEYQITGGSWTGQPVKQGDQYVRNASFSGTKTVPYYVASFKETDDTTVLYTADITYSYITAEAVAVYEPVKDTAIDKIIAVLVFAIAVSLIIFFLKKREKKSDDE